MKSELNMRIYNQIRIVVFCLISGFSVLSAGIIEGAESKLAAQYGTNSELLHKNIEIPESLKEEIQKRVKQKFFRDNLHCWKITQNDTTTLFAVLDNTIGKSMPITFMVIFNEEGSILHTEILKYRESYGGEIQNDSWTEQYMGKNADSKLRVGSEIQGISGATISVHSVNKGIQKLILIYPFIQEIFQ